MHSPLTIQKQRDSIQAPDASNLSLECAGQKQVNEKTLDSVEQPRNVYSSQSLATELNESEETVITGIRATDVVLGLGRTPVGFYTAVHHNGLEWRTQIKCLSVDDDAVEWGGPIPIPSDLSATVCLGVYASFEFQPMLGKGEQLRELTITVEQLLERSTQGLPFVFQEDRGIVSSCSSLSVNVVRQNRGHNDSSGLNVINPHCSTSEFQDDLEDATDQGHRALSRYQMQGEKRDLECSIEQFERALAICPPDHPCRAAAQSNVGEAKLMYCLLGDSDLSLDVPLALYRSALAARPVGHLDRPHTLIQLAAIHSVRFERQRDEADAAQADALLHEAMNLSSVNSYENQTAATMLQLHTSHGRYHVQADGRSSMEQDSASVKPEADPWTLSVGLLHHFKESANLADLQQAISVLGTFLISLSAWDDRYLPGLANLSVALLHRYDRLGDLRDLERTISMLIDVVEFTPDDHPDKPLYLGNLGDSFRVRFKRLGEQSDLEQAISRSRDAVDLTPDNHPDKCTRLSNLGACLRARFKRYGDLNDLEQAISMQMDAVDLTPDGHPDRPVCLSGLGNSFLIRFKRLGELRDLEQAISRHRDAVEFTPDDHLDKPLFLSHLGTSLINRFERLGESSDLEQAISSQWNAVELTPDGHVNKPTCLGSLGISLLTRFLHLGELSDLGQAISKLNDVVDLTRDGHPGKSTFLSYLGDSLSVRFQHLGELVDLEKAILMFRDAVEMTPDDHPDKAGRLDNLGTSFVTRFEHLGDINDLEQAISMQENAVAHTPDGHRHKHTYLNNLGISFSTRFERLGELSDLEQAVSRYKTVVDLLPDGHPDKPACLNNLGDSFHARFVRLGEPIDLEQAIASFKDAISFTPRLNGHPNKAAYLNNLSTALLCRFNHFGELSDLEQAISESGDAVALTPDDHADKPTCLYNLGHSHFVRFERIGDKNDLDQAISRLRDAVDLTADGHVYKSQRLNSLGKSFLARFKLFGESQDFKQAISKQEGAIDLTPDGHPDRPGLLSDLGGSFEARFERLGKPSDLVQALSLFSRAACTSIGSISHRFGASQRWISCARTLRHHSILHAYSIAVGLLPRLAWIGLPLASRYRRLMQGADVVPEAAAAALDAGYPETAVEWLEQGRSIVWGELLQLRSSYDELSSAYPGHAHRLRELSTALEGAGATREKLLSSLSGKIQSTGCRETKSMEQEADKHRMLAIERDKLLQTIRRLPGFERFLLHKEFSQLRASAHFGPVVILNAAETRCDALIILADVEHAIHVPFPNYTLERSRGLQNTLKSLLGPARGMSHDNRYGQPVSLEVINPWKLILSPLWKCVVKPVLDSLAFSALGDLPRIFWCPTGPFTFLPVHAAGFYDPHSSRPGHKVFDFVISSYTPTLNILLPSPERDAVSSGNLRFLAVHQPPSDGLVQLPGVPVELRHIRAAIRASPSARIALVESSVGTVDEVLSLMKDVDWVHFACHGIQDTRDPTRSGLCLAEGRRLQLSDIIALSRSRGGLAFLSACQTASGDEDLCDEAIHIAAGMLFAGYGGVVGTMWSISDKLAPRVAKDVYEQLFYRETRPDYRDAARALQDAVGRLRSSSDASFVDWVPFIHVGI